MNSPQLHNIESVDALELEIKLLQQRIELQEKDLANRVRNIPGELLKSASVAILPAIINKATLSGAWKIFKLVPLSKTLFSFFRKKTGQ